MTARENPWDDKRLAEIRENQSDPIVMYFIVRESLKMSVGKIAAQCAHAAQMIILNWKDQHELKCYDQIMNDWMHSFRKVVLRADDKEFEKVKQELDCFVVRDAGLTEITPGSETVIVLWPMTKSERPKIVRKLQVL